MRGVGGEGDEGGGGVDFAAGADDEHEIGGLGGADAAEPEVLVEHFSEPDDGGAHAAGAFGAVSQGREVGEVQVFDVVAGGVEALVGGEGAVDALDDCGGRGDALVEAVHVLGDEDRVLVALEPGDGVVGGVGVDRGELRAPPGVPVVDELRFFEEAFLAGELHGVVLAPEGVAGGTAEGGDAAVGGDAGPGEDDDAFCISEQFAGAGDVVVRRHGWEL